MKLKIWLALLAIYIAWGSTYLSIRFALETMPPFLLAAGRFLIAGSVLCTWRFAARDSRPSRLELRSAIFVGILLIVGGNGSVVWAQQRVASGVTSLIVAAAPLFMVVIDALRPGGQRTNLQTWIGVLIGLMGIFVLVAPNQHTGTSLDLIGVAVLLMAAFFWSLGSLYGREAQLPKSSLLATGIEMLAGGSGLLILATLTGEWGHFDLAAVSTRSWLGLLYLICVSGLIGFSAYNWLLKVAPTPLVATYAYVNPLVAVFMGYFLAGETLNARILIATAIIVGSVALINSARYGAPKLATSKMVETPE